MNNEESEFNLVARGKFEPVMDLCKAHLELRERGSQINIANSRSFTTHVWLWMARIALAYGSGQSKFIELDTQKGLALAKDYVQRKLGREDGETFLTELSPIPTDRTNNQSWMNWFERQDAQLSERLVARRQKLRDLIRQHSPEIVVCYGMDARNKFRDFLGLQTWEWVCDQPRKIGKSADSRCLMLPFFGNGQMGHAVFNNILRHKLLEARR